MSSLRNRWRTTPQESSYRKQGAGRATPSMYHPACNCRGVSGCGNLGEGQLPQTHHAYVRKISLRIPCRQKIVMFKIAAPSGLCRAGRDPNTAARAGACCNTAPEPRPEAKQRSFGSHCTWPAYAQMNAHAATATSKRNIWELVRYRMIPALDQLRFTSMSTCRTPCRTTKAQRCYLLSSNRACSGHTAAPATPLVLAMPALRLLKASC